MCVTYSYLYRQKGVKYFRCVLSATDWGEIFSLIHHEIRFRIQNKAKTSASGIIISQHLGLIILRAFIVVFYMSRNCTQEFGFSAPHFLFRSRKALQSFLCSALQYSEFIYFLSVTGTDHFSFPQDPLLSQDDTSPHPDILVTPPKIL